MGGTKIFVLQVKDLIRLGLFVIAGIVVLILLAFFLLQRPGQNEEAEFGGASPSPVLEVQRSYARYIPGTYSASIVLNDRPVEIFVTVTENEIVSVEMSELYESQRMLFPLFEDMMQRVSDDVIFYQTADIVIHNDSPVTTGILQQAVLAALDQAMVD